MCPARGWGNYALPQARVEQPTIMFGRKPTKNTHVINKMQNSEYNHQKLFLLSKSCEFPIFKVIPRQFSISTKNGTSYFNLDMLKETSTVISDFNKDHPNEMHYLLNIVDENNALSKFEQLFQGKTVIFDEDEIPSCQRITKILQIKNCPNYLKPESLRTNEFYSNGNKIQNWEKSDLKSGVEICQGMFTVYLKSEKLKTFTIKTSKKEYKCNKFGIYSSNKIREFLEQNPTSNEYVYDFEDEDEEFQSICDLFNFEQIDIKSDNMDSLKEFAENLGIDCILKQVDNYIYSYEKFSEKVDEQQTIIDSIDNLFNLLYNIKNIGINEVKITIAQSKWVQNEESVQELAAFILQVVKPNFYLHQEMADLLIQLNDESNELNKLEILIPFIVDNLMNFFMSNLQQFYSYESSYDDIKPAKLQQLINYPSNLMYMHSLDPDNRFIIQFIRILYNKGIIPKERIIEKLKQFDFKNKMIDAFFLPEIIELESNNIDSFIRVINDYFGFDDCFVILVNKYLPDKIDLYKKMLDNMEPDDELTKSLRNDDVDTLQLIITRNEIDIPKATVPYNIFDDFDENPTFINYAALYGSTKCFKYLLLNDAIINKVTMYFAVYGCNTEIIKIVDQKLSSANDFVNNDKDQLNFKFFGSDSTKIIKTMNNKSVQCIDYKNNNCIISSTIILHQNELFDWIFEKLFVNNRKSGNDLNNIAYLSASNGNAHSLIEIIDKGFDISSQNIISYSAKNGFCKLTQLLLSIIEQKLLSVDFNEKFDSRSSVHFGNLSIFKLFFKQMNQSNLEKAIIYAIELNNIKIIDYYFDHFDELDFKLTSSFVTNSLNISFKTKTDELFNYLFEKFKVLNPELFDLQLFINILDIACLYSNLPAVETIVDIILKENPKHDFSSAFIEASSSGSINICQYLIDKNVYIDYDELSSQVSELGLINDELFALIISKVSPYNKHSLLSCIDQAIQKKNKKLIAFLLNENAPIRNALFSAVSTHDIEIVDLILNYNSKPSFINQKAQTGTALHIACENGDIAIVKRLLSIPGIDPSLLNHNFQSPISIAIKNYDADTFSAILDFYGDELHLESQVVGDIIVGLSNYISNPRILKIVERFVKTKSIDPNYYYDQCTLFFRACSLNQIEVVKNLLKLERIDVNKYDIEMYDTPLITAINGKYTEIVELLIKHPKTNINLKNIRNESALTLAAVTCQKEIIKLLLEDERFDPIESRVDYAFYLANNEIAKLIIDSTSFDVNNVIYDQEFDFDAKKVEKNALIYSVFTNNIEKINMIINHPSFDKYKSDIVKAIFVATQENNVDIFKLLIGLVDNDINIHNQQYKSLLFAAANNSNGEIIDEILNNSNFDPKDNSILDAFVYSYCLTKLSMIPRDEYQIQNNGFIPDKSTPTEVMDKLLKYDKNHDNLIDFNKLLPDGKSFFTCIDFDYDINKDVSDFLLEHGVDPNVPDKKGVFPLEQAIKIKSIGFINSLMNSNKINYSQLPNGNSYLHIAAKYSNEVIFKYLLDKNLFDINATNENGETPLFEACNSGNIEIIDILFEKDNLDYLHRNNNDKDALLNLKSLPQIEYEEVRQTKKAYYDKLISIVNENSGPPYNKKKFSYRFPAPNNGWA